MTGLGAAWVTVKEVFRPVDYVVRLRNFLAQTESQCVSKDMKILIKVDSWQLISPTQLVRVVVIDSFEFPYFVRVLCLSNLIVVE